MNELDRIVASTREELAGRRRAAPVEAVQRAAAQRSNRAGDRRSFAGALRAPGLSVIAEHKRRSPSAGTIRAGLALEEVVRAYQRGGAAALSILTEGPSFGGCLEDLRAARAKVTLPILRKDFMVDPYQVSEAFAAGADAILLIVAALSQRQLQELHAQALELGLDVLVEVHDERELDAAVGLGAGVIGINNRDLKTLRVDTRRTFELLPSLPAGTLVVAESGFSRREELDELLDAGASAVLIGEALMRAPDIEVACRGLTASSSGRSV
ncbi:MAG: indole-3-glycerol phosphate synthase TrpC [Solirubrobacteraceae bacterium]